MHYLYIKDVLRKDLQYCKINKNKMETLIKEGFLFVSTFDIIKPNKSASTNHNIKTIVSYLTPRSKLNTILLILKSIIRNDICRHRISNIP